jgi:uncharacterized membrane protein
MSGDGTREGLTPPRAQFLKVIQLLLASHSAHRILFIIGLLAGFLRADRLRVARASQRPSDPADAAKVCFSSEKAIVHP